MDISIIEFIVYGLGCYSGIILLIISAFRDTPNSKSQSILRSMYLSISVICAILLSGSGVDITLDSNETTTTITNNYQQVAETGAIIDLVSTENVTTSGANKITLLNPAWISLHYLFAVVMLVYIIVQILTLFTKVS